MPDVNRRGMEENQLLNHTTDKEQRLLPGRSTHAGNLSPSEKKLQEAICMLLVELCERFTFFGIVCNMILFCTVKLGYRNYQAAIVNMCFVGTSMLTPVLVGWLAECLVGRIKLVCICMFLHFLGTSLLPVVAFPFEDIYIDRRHILHTLSKREQKIVFYFALLTASLGIGGIRAIVCPLSAYSLEDCGSKELLSFFNWFYWLINLNSAVVFVIISYIQQSVARNLGYLIPFVSMVMAMITIHMVRGEMIYKPKTDSSLLTTFGVIASALKTCCVRYRYFSSSVTNWLDHSKENYGGQYSETQVESTKSLVRLFPLFAFQILYRTCIMQIPSGYYLQTMNSNLHFSGFVLPVAAMNVISIVPLLILVPILECINSYLFSSKDTGRSPTIYIVVGQLSAALSVVVAGFSEIHRKHFPQVEQKLSEEVLLVSSMPCFHLAPQYILLGVAEALVTPSCSLLSFQLVPERIRGISMHFLTLFNGAGCFMGAFFVQTAHAGTQVVGQLSAALSVVVAGFSEIHRKHFPQVEQKLSEEVLLVSSMPCFHLAPQYILLGVAEALVTPSCSLLSFQLVPERIRGISMHFLTLFNGAGCFMGAFFVQTAHAGTQGNWFPHLLHEGKLERFFFFLASLMMVNTLGFWTIAHRYNNLHQEYTNEFGRSLPEEKLLKHEKDIKHYDSVLESCPVLSPMEKT